MYISRIASSNSAYKSKSYHDIYHRDISGCICSTPMGPRSKARVWNSFKSKSAPTYGSPWSRAASHARARILLVIACSG